MRLSKLLQRFSKQYSLKTQGTGFDYQVGLYEGGKQISFWHDVSLYQGDYIVNIGIEIPQNKLAKMELSKTLPLNPIVQDTNKNKFSKEKQLRYYAQFPCFNYGFLPQTWESSLRMLHENYKGDDDPLDCLEISERNLSVGDILKVKVLGAFCVLDQGEIDWKIITMNTEDAQSLKINSFDDYLKLYPWRASQILDWFRYIKTLDGKKSNPILFNDTIFGPQEAWKVIHENNVDWKILTNKDSSKSEGLAEKRNEFNIK